jgi:uncharacterized phage protein (TIGR02218 family)
VKPSTTTLNSLFASRNWAKADLYQFSLVNAGNLYYCAGDADIVYNGNTYTAGKTAGGPFFDREDNRAKCHWKVGLAVDQLVFDVIPGSALVNGQGFVSAVHDGVFDAAECIWSRAYFPIGEYGNISAGGVVLLFLGRVAEVDAGRSLATFTVNSHLELFNQNMPRNIYQSGCLNTLYDTACTLSSSNFSATGTATASSTASLINTALASQPTGYYTLGTVTFTSGANSGVSRTVQVWFNGPTGSSIAVYNPFPNAPAIGDAFTISAGCDKQLSTCLAKFQNVANFRGFPFIPVPETSA